jgi:hypothetical protein
MIPEDTILHGHRRENLISYWLCSLHLHKSIVLISEVQHLIVLEV